MESKAPMEHSATRSSFNTGQKVALQDRIGAFGRPVEFLL